MTRAFSDRSPSIRPAKIAVPQPNMPLALTRTAPPHSPRYSRTARASLAAVAAILATGLSGCYVVPVDSRTGQAWPPYTAMPGGPTAQGSQPTHTAHSAPTVPYTPAPPPGPVLLHGRLYPVNDTANQAGVLTAQVNDHHGGRGSISLNYKGHTLQGEATRVEAGYASFGRVHEEVLGPSTRPFTGRRGVANAHGGGGVGARCEYVITGPTLGTGACVFSDGAKYQLHFGN
jgi:hypothetical protein